MQTFQAIELPAYNNLNGNRIPYNCDWNEDLK